MKKILTVAMLVGFSTFAGAQSRLADQVRQAVVQEETGKNVDKAIQDYEKILAQFDADRAAAATALFRLAECYRKAGKSEPAIAAYERVVREFSDQAALARSSRQQLVGTYGRTEPVTKASAEIAQLRRQLEAAEKARQAARPVELAPEHYVSASGAEGLSTESAKLDIQFAEQKLVQAQKLYETGRLSESTLMELGLKLENAKQRYQQAVTMREASLKEAQADVQLATQTIRSVEMEVDVVQKRIAEVQKNVAAGATAQEGELLPLRRDLIQLQLKLDQLKIQLQLKQDQLRLLAKR